VPALLHVTLLGGQVLADAAGTVRLRSSRTIALVAFLVAHTGRPQTRQHIAALFWPDSTDEQALTNLRRELHHLRGALGGDPALVVTSRDLCWQDTATVSVDVREFGRERAAALAAARTDDVDAVLAHASAAVDRYQGEFLPGSYEDWALAFRDTLDQQCVELLDLLRDTRARTGDLIGAVEVARRRIQLRHLEETGYRAMMTLQGDLGDRAGAVSTYHRCASVLERELGVEPDPATQAVLTKLLAREGPAVTAVSASEPAVPRSGPAAAPLVGRHREARALVELWRTAATGRPAVAVVRGDPGVGKSRLVAEVAAACRHEGAVVAQAQCFGTSGRLALAPVGDWLRIPEVQAAHATLDAVWRAEVDRLVPSERTRRDHPAGQRAMADSWQRHRFYEGLTRALVAVGRPLLLVLDNLHWCDQETLAFITFCLGLAADAPIMIAATLRDEDRDQEPGLGEWLARTRAAGLLTEIPLGPLEAADTAALTEAIIGRPLTDADVEVVQVSTGGIPLSIIEAARSVDDDPANAFPVGNLTSVLHQRWEQLSPTGRQVIGLAAAVGRDFTLDLLTEASDLPADEVVRVVDELWRRRILREVGDGYDFSHDLLRDAAYREVSPPQRWLLHRRIAQGLELLHADDPDAVSAQLAEQYARGGRGERAVTYYQRAAEIADCMFAHAEAIRLCEAALSVLRRLPEGADRAAKELKVLEAMAAPLSARYGYSSPQLQEALERAIALAERLRRRGALINGLIGLWYSLYVRGETAAANRAVDRALTLVEPNSELSGPVHFEAGVAAVTLGRPAEGLRHFAIAASLGRTSSLWVGTDPDVHGMAFAAQAHWLLGHDDDTQASSAGAVALARATGSPFNLAIALGYRAVTHHLCHDVPALATTAAELRELCRRYDFAYYGEWGLILDGWVQGGTRGLALARQGVEALTAAGSFTRMPYWLSIVADLAARTDRTEEAAATLDAALAAGRARDDLWWLPEVMRMRAAYDNPDQAVRRLTAAARLATQHGSVRLLRRCRDDLDALGVPTQPFGVPPTA
jgi:DNA-binding SARP family transcriptional activator/tetratricopeptide (TPR) repeat protein